MPKLQTTLDARLTASITGGKFLALLTAAPTNTATGAGYTEVTGGGYARISITPGTNFSNSPVTISDIPGVTGETVARALSNLTDITFGPATANWGTITHWAIFPGSSAGNPEVWNSLLTPRSVVVDDQVKFAIGELTLYEGNT